jgi:hypothetical protein
VLPCQAPANYGTWSLDFGQKHFLIQSLEALITAVYNFLKKVFFRILKQIMYSKIYTFFIIFFKKTP